MQQTVLITGATGFLGCHIAEYLCNKNFHVIATKRMNSNLKNCLGFIDNICWVDIDQKNWKDELIAHKPQIIIHAAWIGVEASERYNWDLQSENLFFLNDLLVIAFKSKTKKIIGLGSQGEYGYINTRVSELHPLNPTSAYGALKIIASQVIKNFCVQNSIEWYWLRIFSVFGEKESDKWLIPSVIKNIYGRLVNEMEFSDCDQQYAYLYINDFISAVEKVIITREDKSGIFNISSIRAEKLKNIITYLRDSLNPSFILKFGALPYRPNQSMLVHGNSSKFIKMFDHFESTLLWNGLNNVITFYTA